MHASDAQRDAGDAGTEPKEVEAVRFEILPGFPPRIRMDVAFLDGTRVALRMPPAFVHRMSDDALRIVAQSQGSHVLTPEEIANRAT